jgi:hypothetical protein
MRNRLRTALGVTDMSLAFVLLAGAALLLRTFAKLQEIAPVPEPTRVIAARLPLAEARFRRTEAFHNYLGQITDALTWPVPVFDAVQGGGERSRHDQRFGAAVGDDWTGCVRCRRPARRPRQSARCAALGIMASAKDGAPA